MNAFKIEYNFLKKVVTIVAETIGSKDAYPVWKDLKTKAQYLSHDYSQDCIAHGKMMANRLWDQTIAEICHGVWSELPEVEIHQDISSDPVYDENRKFLGWERTKRIYKKGAEPKTVTEIN